MNIEEDQKEPTITIEPIEDPVRKPEREPEREPVKIPVETPEREKVPA
jgi:hypothetical protein